MNKEIKRYLNDFKEGTNTTFKQFFNKETNKKQRANMWTFSRLVIPFITAILSTIAIITGILPLFIISGGIAGFGAVTDWFDGKSSRKHKSTSEFGKLLDQASDKVFTGIIGINLSFINPSYLIILIGEAIIASINIGYKKKNKDLNIESTKMGKIKQWPLYLTLALGYLSPISQTLFSIADISIILTLFFQGLTTYSYIEQNNKNIKDLERNNKFNTIFEEIESNNQLDKSLQKGHQITNNKTNSRKEQYTKLRDLLLELKNKEEEQAMQKTKK